MTVDAIATPPVPTVQIAPPEAAGTLSPGVRAMIEAAIASGDPAAVATVVRLAKQTNPDSAEAIDAIEADWRRTVETAKKQDEAARREKLASAGITELWKGSVEAGGSRASGNTDSFGLYGAVALEREGLNWRHKLNARVDYQQTNDVTTTERWLLSWQPNYKISDRAYAYGVGSYEHDQLLGYDARYVVGGGLGYGLVRTPKLKLDFEGGPAVRLTDYVAREAETSLAARASMTMNWALSPTLQLSNTGSVYYEAGNTSASATAAIDTKLIGKLKARLSYDLKYESQAPNRAKPVDTLSRATLVYSF